MFNFLSTFVGIAYAAVPAGTIDVSSWQPENFGGMINLLIRLLVVIGALSFTALFIVGGIKYITSSGDVKAIDGAKRSITASLIGILLIASSYAMAITANKLLGVPTFGGKIAWDGGGTSSGGVSWRGDYALCESDFVEVFQYRPSCTAPKSAACCSPLPTSHGCIDIGAVGKYSGWDNVTQCETSLAACSTSQEGKGQVDWAAWRDWVSKNNANKKVADDLCIKCNLCNH